MSNDRANLTYKTIADARVVDETKTAATSDQPWWGWVQDHVARQINATIEATGRVVAHERRAFKRELDLLKRELITLREEVAVERKLADLKAAIPSVPDIEKRIADEQAAAKKEMARLRRELADAKSTISTLRAEASQTAYVLSEMSKQPRSASASDVARVEDSLKQTLTLLREHATEEMLETMRACGLLEPKPEKPHFVAGHLVPNVLQLRSHDAA